MSNLIEQARSREWFYSYELPDGSTTPTYHGSDIQSIHDTRWQMLRTAWSRISAPAGMACPRWTWLRTRAGLLTTWREAVFIRAGYRCPSVSRGRQPADCRYLRLWITWHFQQGDIHQQSPEQLGQFDVVLMLGLLYHLENPVGALRVCRSCAKTVHH